MGKTKSWITSHQTVERTMTHDFGSGIKIIVDWNFSRVMKLKDGCVVENIPMEEFTLSKYEQLLIDTEKEIAR